MMGLFEQMAEIQRQTYKTPELAAHAALVKSERTREAIDKAVECIATHSEPDHWISYFLESIESTMGEDGIEITAHILALRRLNGGW